MAETLFEVDGLCGWGEEYDESDPESVTAVLTVETDRLRHTLTVTGLQDARWLNEVFGRCYVVRVQYDEEWSPQYLLQIVFRDSSTVDFPVTSFGIETRSLPKHDC
jgi:hypothetical protein